MGAKGYTERAAERRPAEITRRTEATLFPVAGCQDGEDRPALSRGQLLRLRTYGGHVPSRAAIPGRTPPLLDVLGSLLIQVGSDQNDLAHEYLFSRFSENVGKRRIRITFFCRHERVS